MREKKRKKGWKEVENESSDTIRGKKDGQTSDKLTDGGGDVRSALC